MELSLVCRVEIDPMDLSSEYDGSLGEGAIEFGMEGGCLDGEAE